jgi:uridine kinase
MIKVYCENNGQIYECRPGTNLGDLARQCEVKLKWPILAAVVDNQLKELGFEIFVSHNIRFIDYSHPDGYRTYVRSLNFLLQRAVATLYPDKSLILDYTLWNGVYGELRESVPGEDNQMTTVILSEQEISAIGMEMERLVKAGLPFTRIKLRTTEAVELFRANKRPEKAFLHTERGKFFTTVYYLDGYADHYYGPLLENTGMLTSFNFESFSRGFLIQSPQLTNPYTIVKTPYQYKLFDVFKEYSDWCSILGVKNIGTVNNAIKKGKAKELIQIAEALHERKYAGIADEIYKRRDTIKLVLIAGPSSSGKTTTSKRVALQLKVLGLNPVVIELDNYFVDREHTPRDSEGNYDFEVLGALDTAFMNKQLNELFEGKEVDLPKFDFAEGKRTFRGDYLSLKENDILIMEGIHGLNPLLTAGIEESKKFRIYASALTSLSIDENNSISTSDNRLLRRIVRDGKYRGAPAEDVIMRWQSVRRGEINNIFPYQENADIMFNSALIFELPLLKYYAEPQLRRIAPNSPASTESIRLLKFLSYIQELQPDEIGTVPPTSIMREFIGGSSFSY